MIGPLLRVAASAAAARSLRSAANDVMNRALLTMAAALSIAVGAVFLTASAWAVIERQLDPASASAIVGAFWALLGLGYFVFAAMRRRRT
jgi:cell division protein FtsW (lipid II flippase)